MKKPNMISFKIMTAGTDFKPRELIKIDSKGFEYLVIGRMKMPTMYQYTVIKNPKRFGWIIYWIHRIKYLLNKQKAMNGR